MRKVFLFLPFLIFLFGCQSPNLLDSHVAEIHYCFFTAQNNLFLVNVWSGKREEPYEMDGVSSRLVDFTLVSVLPLSDEPVLSCSLDVNGKNYVLSLEQSPFDSSVACDLGFLVTPSDSLVIYLSNNSESEGLKLKCESNEFKIDYKSALCVATKQVSEFLKDKSEQNFEIYLKIITNTERVKFWYFRLLTSGHDFSCVIDVNTGEVLVSS